MPTARQISDFVSASSLVRSSNSADGILIKIEKSTNLPCIFSLSSAFASSGSPAWTGSLRSPKRRSSGFVWQIASKLSFLEIRSLRNSCRAFACSAAQRDSTALMLSAVFLVQALLSRSISDSFLALSCSSTSAKRSLSSFTAFSVACRIALSRCILSSSSAAILDSKCVLS